MRLLRHKANRKTLHHFRIVHGVHPPYRILLDGNFVAVAERLKMEWRRLLPKLLEQDAEGVHFHITECILSELEALGPAQKVAQDAAATLPVVKCRHKHGHTEDMDAASCIRALVGPKNGHHWAVATQDGELRKALREVPGVPIILISSNVLVLEPPSTASKSFSAAAEVSKTGLRPQEAQAVKAAAKALRGEVGGGTKVRRPRPSEEEGGAGSSSASAGPAAAGAGTASAASASFSWGMLPKLSQLGKGGAAAAGGGGGGAGGALAKKKKKPFKGMSGPNPLSVRKKRTREEGSGASSKSSGGDGDDAARKRHRRKHKTAGGGGSGGGGEGGGEGGED